MSEVNSLTKSEPVSPEQIEKYISTVGKETAAEISMDIVSRLQDACEHVGNVYLELEQKFPEIMAAMGFSVIATCNALPIDVENTPVCIVVGSARGIQHAAQPLIKAFNEIQQEVNHDKKARG